MSYIYTEHGSFAVRIPVEHRDDATQADLATWYADGSDEGPESINEACWIPLWELEGEIAEDFYLRIHAELAFAVSEYDRESRKVSA